MTWGHKTGGRKKGTPNVSTTLRRLALLAAAEAECANYAAAGDMRRPTQQRRPDSDVVYFVADGSAVKVGLSSIFNLRDRISTLQVSTPRPVRLIRLLRGGAKLEQTVHRHFREKRIRGDWFDLDASEWSHDFGAPDLPVDPALARECVLQTFDLFRDHSGASFL